MHMDLSSKSIINHFSTEKRNSADASLGSEPYYISLPAFEGPFDLLYHLITREKVDIWDIPLGPITAQYLDYLHSMSHIQVEVAGDFLVMAASLLQLKSRLLLPRPATHLERDEEVFFFGSKEELVRCLLEYRRFKLFAEKLKEREVEQERIYLRSSISPKVIIRSRKETLYPYPADTLKLAAQKICQRIEEKNRVLDISPPGEIFFRDKIKHILRVFQRMAVRVLSLDNFLERKGHKGDLVATFYALLELARRGRLFLRQEHPDGSLQVYLKPPELRDK